MTARSARGRLLLVAALALACVAPRDARAEAPAETASDDHATSPSGHRFRVRFDPASRIRVGLAASLTADAAGGLAPTAELSHGLGYRALYTFGRGSARVAWEVEHRVLAGWVAPTARDGDGIPALDESLYRVSCLRHDESPSIVLPLSPPVGVPFPFDIGLEADLGSVAVPRLPPLEARGDGAAPVVRLGVARAALLLDPWRSGEPGRSFALGVGVRYDVDAYAGAAPGRARKALSDVTLVHRVAPMTAGLVRLRLQSRDGLTTLDARGEVVPHWTSEEAWSVMALSAARVERILAAINDEPIALVLDGGYRMTPATAMSQASHEARASLGLAFNLALK